MKTPAGCLFFLVSLVLAPTAGAQEVKTKELPDRTEALQRLVEEQKGDLRLAAGKYRITKTIEFDLAKLGAASVSADGPVTVIMAGEGPAFRFVGTHEGTAAPETFVEATWKERMPLIDGFEILGAHPKADGIELDGTMMATITRVVVRRARHGIHLVNRNRNVTITSCHLYENSGVGIFYDDVDLHQSNIGDCHVSYNREGGVVVRDGNVRNVHIGNCDIEGNMPVDGPESLAANVWIDSSKGGGQVPTRSIAEIAITGCTIQHTAKNPQGANVRITGHEGWPVDMVTVANNVISDASVNLHFDWVNSATVTGNTFFSPIPADVLVTRSSRIVLSGNVFDPRHMKKDCIGGVVFRDCRDSVVTGNVFTDIKEPKGALVLEKCEGFTLIANRFANCEKGIVLVEVSKSIVTACAVDGVADGNEAIELRGGKGVQVLGNAFGGENEKAPE